MDIPSTKSRSPRTARTRSAKAKAAEILKNVPTALLLKRKAECDARALKIVEQMIEPEVDVDWLLESLSHINKSHMDDIVEERSIVKLCGYPLCDKPLKKIVNKQYQISTLRNKVYDVSKVKNFCSYSCYTATEYLTEQMLTSPLWHREQEEIPEFKILPKSQPRSRSPPGVEVDLAGIQLPKDDDDEEQQQENDAPGSKSHEVNSTGSPLPKEDQNVEEIGNKERPDEVGIRENIPEVKVSSVIASEDKTNCIVTEEKANYVETQNENQTVISTGDETNKPEEINRDRSSVGNSSKPVLKPSREAKKTERRKPRESKKSISFETLTSRVEKSFAEWITEETICLLRGENSERQRILENVRTQEKYAVLCKKLNHLQVEEEREGNDRILELQPPPEFAALQEEAKTLELKVRAFYEGRTVIDRNGAKLEDSVTQESNEPEVVLPMTDIHAPKALRRRIFLDKLNKVLPDLLRALGGSGQTSSLQYSYTSERCATVRALVTTFSLSATNIMFKTPEWTLIALIIIKLLTFIDLRMKYLLASKQASLYISMILLSYKLDSNYLDRLVVSLITPAMNAEETESLDT